MKPARQNPPAKGICLFAFLILFPLPPAAAQKVVATISSTKPGGSDPVEVPFEYSRAFGLMLIKVEVNGKPAVMVLDTGSNETIISPRLVIVRQLSSKDAVAMAKGSGYSGNGVVATAFLSIGQMNPKNCQILVVDLSDLPKLLGRRSMEFWA